MDPVTQRQAIDFSGEVRAEDLLIELMAESYDHNVSPMENALQHIESLRRNPGP